MTSGAVNERTVRKRSASQADNRLDDEPEPPPAPARQRPSSASPTCRYERAISVWVKKRLALLSKSSPSVICNHKLTVGEKNAVLKRTYSQPLNSLAQLRTSPSRKTVLRKLEAKENRPKPPRLNLSGIQMMETRMRQCAEFFGYDSVQVVNRILRG